ncbi:putative major facilitator superfamily protein [Lyophyllum shimeji]|uniref:Major facilitator superfamily protein n=1 Tax=Lyophyllum shimeji TaxID=47721 RepID=A0A9P3PTK1_LYOSH|nr:putative major facilitator superfamily protein [Lyophyllum shimeji]
MPSEPIEAELGFPPALSPQQEEEFRILDQEGPLTLEHALSRSSQRPARDPEAQYSATQTVVGTPPNEKVSIGDLAAQYRKDGVKIVEFEKGAGEDPREWSFGKKWYVTGTTSFLCLAVALGSSIVTGDMEGPVATFHTQQEIVNLTVTCFVIGFGVGPLLFAPFSEVVGRKPIYMFSMFLYFIFTLPCALSKNVATLVVCRQIAGLAASAPMTNVGGTISDVWAVENRGIPMAIFSGTLFMGPCVGPLVGGWIGQRAGWRWIYWVLFIFLGVCCVLTAFIPETLAPVILRRKAERLRKETGDSSYNTIAEMERLPLSTSLKIALTRPLKMMFTEPIILFMSFYLSFLYSLLYLLFFAFPIAFLEVRGWGLGITGVTFISIMLGIALAIGLMPQQEKVYARVTADGSFPEARLYPMMIGAFLLPSALFIFAFTGAYKHVHWIGVCASGFVFGVAMIIIYISANTYIVDSFSSYAASALAAKTLMRSLVGATVPLFVTQMFHGMGFQYAGLLLALVGCAIGPIPFVFYRYGGQIRTRSNMATKVLRGQGAKGDPDVGGH